MRSTLTLFFSIFLTLISYAKIDTLYTESDSIITRKIIKSKGNHSTVLEEKSLKNTTCYSFSNDELDIIFAENILIKDRRPLMESLFLPKFFKTWQEIKVTNEMIKEDKIITEPEFSLFFLITCMILPFLGIMFFSIRVQKGKEIRILSFYFFLLLAVLLKKMSDTNVFSEYLLFVFSGIAAIVGVVVSGKDFQSSLSVAMVVIFVSAGVSAPSDIFIGFQYFVFILCSCLFSFLIRNIYLKQKDNKILT